MRLNRNFYKENFFQNTFVKKFWFFPYPTILERIRNRKQTFHKFPGFLYITQSKAQIVYSKCPWTGFKVMK